MMMLELSGLKLQIKSVVYTVCAAKEAELLPFSYLAVFRCSWWRVSLQSHFTLGRLTVISDPLISSMSGYHRRWLPQFLKGGGGEGKEVSHLWLHFCKEI